MNLGIVGGPNYTTFFGNKHIGNFYKPGVKSTTGIIIDYDLDNRFNINTALLREKNTGYANPHYSSNSGKKVSFYGTESSYYQLNIPLTLKIKIVNRKVNLFAILGPQYQYLLKQEVIQYFEKEIITKNQFTNNFNRNNIGLVSSLGSSLSLNSSLNFNIELRNHLGLSSLSKRGDIKINSLNLLFGLTYRL